MNFIPEALRKLSISLFEREPALRYLRLMYRDPTHYRKKSMSKIILSIIFLLSLCPGAWATTYYVDNAIPDTHISSSIPDFTTYDHPDSVTTKTVN